MKTAMALILSAAFLLSGCASSQSSSGPVVGDDSGGYIGLRGAGLDDLLAQEMGVRVEGRGSRARIHVSGADYPTPPLFVVDGTPIGQDFSTIYSLVTGSDVQTINVIRANDTAAVAWGARGGNGVIEIVTKRGE